MRLTIRVLTAACSGALLLACGTTGVGVAPVALATAPPPSQATADGYYTLGRSQHAGQRYAEALESYRKALQLDPLHVNARNGLAVLYAGQGDYARAIALWRELAPQDREGMRPEAAFLLGNLGYAYFLSGDTDKALAALEKACLLDPHNALTWEHLGRVLEQLGQGERAAAMLKQAAALRQHDAGRDYALLAQDGEPRADGKPGAAAEVVGTSTAIGTALDSGSVKDVRGASLPDEETGAAWPQLARTEVLQSGAAMVQIRRVAARSLPIAKVSMQSAPPAAAPLPPALPVLPVSPPPAAAAAAPPAAAALPRLEPKPALSARLEISNGNGVNGMAAAMANTLRGDALQVVRLSNVRNFSVPQSRIEYEPRQQDAAQALATRLGVSTLARHDDCRPAELRLVLGHDLRNVGQLRQRYLK
ncbi:LytR C-terminal domain-containing protein [Oxalobacteraceae bacterium]|nr:LytR C-terminal domain-containing protein [Oxalobacteraceae bacterium]